MAEPLISVLIPCYNAERVVAETLESVFAQTWRNLEVVVVNDGSRDRSGEVIRSFERPNLKLVSQDNRGQTAALNRALREAQGDFIQYLDADDVLLPDKLELQMRRLLAAPDCLATSEWARFWRSRDEAVFRPEYTWRDLAPVDWLVEAWHDGGGMLFPGMYLSPRSLVDRIGPWREDLTLNNDAEYFCRLVLAAREVLFCPGSRVLYRSGNPNSLASTKTKAGWESQFKVTEHCERELLAAEDSDRTRRAVSLLWQRLGHASYPYVPGLAEQAMARGARLHPVRLTPSGGPVFAAVSRVLGWRLARRLQLTASRARARVQRVGTP